MTPEALLELAAMAVDDPDARCVLGDAILEGQWFDERAVFLVYGIPFEAEKGRRYGQREYERKRERLIKGATESWWYYADGRVHDDQRATWARAIFAVMLFQGWAPALKRRSRTRGTRAPWPAIKACCPHNADLTWCLRHEVATAPVPGAPGTLTTARAARAMARRMAAD